jgi:hypothetical protein
VTARLAVTRTLSAAVTAGGSMPEQVCWLRCNVATSRSLTRNHEYLALSGDARRLDALVDRAAAVVEDGIHTVRLREDLVLEADVVHISREREALAPVDGADLVAPRGLRLQVGGAWRSGGALVEELSLRAMKPLAACT